MLRYTIILAVLLLSLLQANQDLTECREDTKTMMNSYYTAQKQEVKRNYIQAQLMYNRSISAADAALSSCETSKDYDYNVMYSFIVESQTRRDSLYFFLE
jgi:phage FluMu gp28-like protein